MYCSLPFRVKLQGSSNPLSVAESKRRSLLAPCGGGAPLYAERFCPGRTPGLELLINPLTVAEFPCFAQRIDSPGRTLG